MRPRLVPLIVILALGILPAPLAADAQQAGKVHRIGGLETGSRSGRWPLWEAFREKLRELGYIEGQNVTIDYRWAEGRTERLPDLAVELIRLKVDVIVTGGTQAAQAAMQATSTIPIVMATGGDPVGTGLVKSLARPGGNVTGMSSMLREVSGKRLELLREAVPKAARLAFLFDETNPGNVREEQETQVAARSLGVTLQTFRVRALDELDAAFSAMRRERAGALIVGASAMFYGERRRLAALAVKHRLPTMLTRRDYAEAGGLMAYGSTISGQFRQAAVYVDKILKGAKPADLPIEQPTKFELVINLKTAKALGLTIPKTVLIRADQVIQ